MPQSVLDDIGLPGVVEDVRIEVVLPGSAAHRTRLDLAERKIAQRKNAQSFEQRSRDVLE
jgi:hypothetical protein